MRTSNSLLGAMHRAAAESVLQDEMPSTILYLTSHGTKVFWVHAGRLARAKACSKTDWCNRMRLHAVVRPLHYPVAFNRRKPN